MKVMNVNKLKEKYDQYDISTYTENFYVKTGDTYSLIHNSPAVFAGIDPSDGQFFVAKKGVFNKNPKVYKTPEDVDSDTSGDLAVKLKAALNELKKLGITSGVYQGDLMFTKDDIKTETIDGEQYITFHPNTIMYAVPYDSLLGKQIRAANIGVVWHTTYEGNSFETMSASFGKDIANKFKSTPDVWSIDATYKDLSGNATFTKSETDEVTAELSKAGKLFKTINSRIFNDIADNEELRIIVNTYNNSKVRAGERITNPKKHAEGLIKFIKDKFQKEIDKRKTEKGKTAMADKMNQVLSYFEGKEIDDVAKIFELSALLANIKQTIINKLNQAGNINTFLKTKNGFKVTNPEGYVAIDKLSQNAVKIVDRMEFSMANFSKDIIHGWEK